MSSVPPSAKTCSAFFQSMTCRKSKSLAIDVDSSAPPGSSSVPPTAISVLYELMKPKPSLASLPASARSWV